MLIEPPPDIPPDRLFRLLLTVPHPTSRLTFRFSDAPDVALYVRAIHPREASLAIDSAGALHKRIADSAIAAELIAKTILTESGERLFASVSDLDELPDVEFTALSKAVVKELDRVCPMLGRIDQAKWHAALCRGARHITNASDRMALSQCYDVVEYGRFQRIVERPDRFYGVPMREMLYGHWLCYHAARALFEECQQK